MNEHRRQILEMLAEKKITAEEAERLIAAMEEGSGRSTESRVDDSPLKPRAKYLRVQVDAADDLHGEGPTKVNVRVPMQLLRAGVRLAGLIPAGALRQANDAMAKQGLPIDLSQIKPENLEEIVDQLNDLSVDVDQEKGKVKVRVFCE
jgi:SHOCT-like domain